MISGFNYHSANVNKRIDVLVPKEDRTELNGGEKFRILKESVLVPKRENTSLVELSHQ